MFRPSMYDKHDETMLNFAKKFNKSPVCRNIEMRPNPVETYDNDGIFIDLNTNVSIGYDWEYRDRYFANCKLAFENLGQYERKLRKPSIQIALQCDSTETGIAVGWHEDWLQEEKEKRALKTDSDEKENGSTRYTTRFKIYSFKQIDSFKNMVASAMSLQIYSSKIFEKMSEKTQSGIIIPTPSSVQTKDNTNKTAGNAKTLVDFFKSKGLKVVDQRANGGGLWVLGSESEIGPIVKEACREFRVGGSFSSGRATEQKPGWVTKARK